VGNPDECQEPLAVGLNRAHDLLVH
jgi:hypothetical protein